MDVRKWMKLFCLCISLLSLPAPGRFVLTETEIEEFCDERSACTHDPLALCPTRTGDGLFVLTQCMALEKNYYLWKITEDGNVLQKTCLAENEGKIFSFPVKETMILTARGPLLMVHTPIRYGQTGPGTPASYRFSLPHKETEDPNRLTLAIVGDPFVQSLCTLCRRRLSMVAAGSYVTFAGEGDTGRDVLLSVDPDGNVTQSIPIFDPWVELCDYAVSPDEGAVAVVARKQMSEETGRSWGYSAGLLDLHEGRLLQTDLFQSHVYEEPGQDKRYPALLAQELRPRMVALKDSSFLCFYSTPINHESVAVRVRFYSPQFEFLKEKELFRLDCGFMKELPVANTLDAVLFDHRHFVICVQTRGQLAFWVFDLKGDLNYSRPPAGKQKIIRVQGLFSLHKSVVAVVSEGELPSAGPVPNENFRDSKPVLKFYTLHKR